MALNDPKYSDMDKSTIIERLQDIGESHRKRRRKKDGFTPGWQENINAYAGGRREYDRLLKEQGLVELGYEGTVTEDTTYHHPCANEEFAMALKEADPTTSDQEVDAIKSGEYFKD